MSDRIGIELPHIYDGVSVWIEPDGTLTNRWAGFYKGTHRRRFEETQKWIDAYEEEPSA